MHLLFTDIYLSVTMLGNIYAERLTGLRAIMEENGWDAVLVTGSDPHSGEYPALRWKQVEWLSGFTGEAGDMVITQTEAGLWTDSRYFIQAESQLEGTGVTLYKTRQPDSITIAEWVSSRQVKILAVDGLCISADMAASLKKACTDYSLLLVDVPDMLDSLWEDRPSFPVTPVTTLDVDSFGGISRAEKIRWIRKWLVSEKVDSILLTSLDEIAWLLNVRGSDVEYNPVVISYLFVTKDFVKWFVIKPSADGDFDPDTADSFSELRDDGVEILEYDALNLALSCYVDEEPDASVFIDSATLNYALENVLKVCFTSGKIVRGVSPVILAKAVKTKSEIDCLRQTYIEDGLAVECFLYWLEEQISRGVQLTEWEASQKLTEFRSEIPEYRGNSFENISAYGPNAALPHYHTPEVGSAEIYPRGLYLVDSGGHYLTGTTDITRTVPVGDCSALEKEDYTLVLKGMIDLSMAVFPLGTAGCHLDVLARTPLWSFKRNFGHGTGHGIGYWLCVHEGPQDIRGNFNSQPLLPGMVTSNEPGIYREGMYGIRHENVLLCRRAGMNDFGEWLEFETLTCCHIDTSAIVPGLLTSKEAEWLDNYNHKVYETLSARLPSNVAEWLWDKTRPIGGY